MILSVGWSDDGRTICVHVQTQRTVFTVDMTPEQGRELANDLFRVIEIACRERTAREAVE